MIAAKSWGLWGWRLKDADRLHVSVGVVVDVHALSGTHMKKFPVVDGRLCEFDPLTGVSQQRAPAGVGLIGLDRGLHTVNTSRQCSNRRLVGI